MRTYLCDSKSRCLYEGYFVGRLFIASYASYPYNESIMQITGGHPRPYFQKKRARARGFTIVELLIVIIVIAILAAIVIVAYTGVQERARMSGALAFEHSFRMKYGAYATGIWTFNECSGTTVKNTSDTNTTDTISGTVSWITSGTPTGQGCALHFDGTTHIETTSSLGSNWYAKGAWVRLSTAACSNVDNIISQAITNGVQAALFMPNCQPNAGHNGSWYMVGGPTALNDNKWHYIAVTWENGNLTLFIDGQRIATAAAPTPTNATGYVAIGAHGGGSFMIGDIANPFVAAQ